jgi:DNA-binding CsgD family transcriptional regulator
MKDDQQPSLLAPGLNGIDVLNGFQFAGHECWVVQIEDHPSDSSSSIFDSNPCFCELCRFEVSGRICAIIHKRPDLSETQENMCALLTARELQIATLVAMGCPNKQVADKLHISEWTVATYLRRIYAKRGVESRAAMTYRCAPLIGSGELELGATRHI